MLNQSDLYILLVSAFILLAGGLILIVTGTYVKENTKKNLAKKTSLLTFGSIFAILGIAIVIYIFIYLFTD